MADEDAEGGVLDLSDQNLQKLEVPSTEDPTTVIADRNSITRLENLEHCKNLRQLSLASNRLVHMNGVAKLHHLTVLNLPQNSITSVEGVKELHDLVWLNLSGNSIKVMDQLSGSIHLKHLDLSDNSIGQLSDLHLLTNLKTLLLHGNILTSLETAPHFLPVSLVIFSLAENEISDINEVSYLACLPNLQQLSVMNNPCVLMTSSVPGFDYRPFVVNWCPYLQVLDGYMVTEKETLKAEWLYSQGKGHHFKVGQHLDTVQYLAGVCPLTASTQTQSKSKSGKVRSIISRLESAEDAKLSQILSKQRYHQRQLQTQQIRRSVSAGPQDHNWNIPPRSTAQDKRSPLSEQSGHHGNVSTHGKQSLRAWTGDTSISSTHSGQERVARELNDLSIQDVSEDYEKRSTSSLLDSESVYIPVNHGKSPARPMTAPTVSVPPTSFVEFFPRGDNRPATALGDNKYDAYDKRPIKPLNQEMVKGLLKPNFDISQPQQSGNEPVQGAKKSTPPTAQAMDYDTSQDASQIDQILNPPSQQNIPAQDLSRIKDVATKKTKKASLKETSDRRPVHSGSSSSSSRAAEQKKRERTSEHGSRTSIPVAKTGISRTHSDYIPGRYSASKRPATADSDFRSKVKTIKAITDNGMHTDRLSKTEPKRDGNTSLRDSGIYSRPTSDAVLSDTDAKAATKIQSFWRGYYAREHNVDVVRIRREIRARRAEDHIVVLRTELEKQRKMYEQEKQLRTLQLEAIRHLWREVQSLQNWKNEVLSSQNFQVTDSSRQQDYNSYNCSQEIQNTLARAELIAMGQSAGSLQTVDSDKQRELERTCLNLQSQVSQLQEALKSVSSAVLHGSGTPRINPTLEHSGSVPSLQSPRPAKIKRDPDQDLVVTGSFEAVEVSSYGSISNSRWDNVPHSLSPYPSEEEESYFQRVPQPGFPTPPRGLKLEHRGNSSLVLRWQQSKILDAEGKEVNKPLIGYRVFVNDKPKALIAGNKQKALIEGLDVSLTYKIYVKAVSALGESNSSDIVMAALSKSRRRSSSSDSNQSYDSDTESDRRPRRKDSHRTHSRKNKSPRGSNKMEKGNRESSQNTNNSNSSHTEKVMSSKMDEPDGILTTPKVHKHRRTSSKDYQRPHTSDSVIRPKETPKSPTQRSAKLIPQESQGFSFDVRQQKDDSVIGSEQNLSSTFTVDSQNSVLLALSAKGVASLDQSDSSLREDGRSNRQRRSRELKTDTRGDISDSSSSVSSANFPSRNLDISTERKDTSGTDSPLVRRRKGSKENSPQGDTRRDENDPFNRSDSKRNSAKISPTAGSQGVPVIDGRKRHSSGSRPSSPAHSDITDMRSGTANRSRIPMGDLLEQRFSGHVSQSNASTASSSATLTQSQVDLSANDLPPQIPRRQTGSMENLSARSSADYRNSPTERYSSSERRRTNSTCSESDIPDSGVSRQLDMDKKNGSGNSGIVAKLLQKLQTFSKTQEESLKTTKYKRRPGEFAEDERNACQSQGRKASGDSDGSDIVPVGSSRAPVQSDSSSGTHSDDSQQVVRPSYRTHRRTASDHRGVPIKVSDPMSTASQRSDYSPVIMDSSLSGKASSSASSSNNIKRHASFHGILPSKQQDMARSGSQENLVEKGSQQSKQQNIEITVPTTPTRRHRHRSRSRSPGPASPHVPIISVAQLQKQSKAQLS